MINFIIYENEEYYISIYSKAIHQFMALNNDQYRIFIYNAYSTKMIDEIKNVVGPKIFLIDIEMKDSKSGLDLAVEIRNMLPTTNDQIILISSYVDLLVNAFHKRILMLDFLSKYDNIEKNLYECFKIMYVYFNKNKTLLIKQDGELIRIPYDNILYVVKDKSDDCVYIYLVNKKIKYNGTLNSVERKLKNDMRFYKTHRSVIVNVSKITSIDMINLIIYFGKSETLLSRDKKKGLLEHCEVFNNVKEY